MTFQEKLLGILTKEQFLTDEPMSRHTTFQTGGPADYYLMPEEGQTAEIIRLCREETVPFYIIGNGSNLLVGDKGFRGAVIEIGSRISEISREENIICARAGVSLARLAREAAGAGLTGLEFASGIPGTVGGAVVMNAGAYGGEMKDVVAWALILTEDGQLKKLSAGELHLSYRHSIVTEEGGIVLQAAFRLEPGDKEAIWDRMEELRRKRAEKQPLEYPSAGSTFKRPEGYFAGKLIMDTGLRGYRVGDAQVSEKHCGFVINRGQATAADIVKLIQDVRAAVRQQFGVELEPEVKMIGEF